MRIGYTAKPVPDLYGLAVLRGVRRPMALGFKTDEIRRMLTVGEAPPGAAFGQEQMIEYRRMRVLQ